MAGGKISFILVGALFAATACGDDDGDPLIGPRGETDTVDFEELEVEIPEDWDSATNAEETALFLANFHIGEDAPADGAQPLEDLAEDEVLVSIAARLPCEPIEPPRGLPVVVQALDLDSDPSVAATGHAVACYTFVLEGEFLEDGPSYQLMVDFGSESPAPALLDEVNDVLATITAE